MIILIFILVFFLSILVHELGHAIAFRRFGIPSRIVLYWFGGLAIPESTGGRGRGLGNNQQIVVSAAGPLAGFALAGLFAAVVIALGGKLGFEISGIFPLVIPDLTESSLANNPSLKLFFFIGLFCNLFWNILNLVPVLPLDGGQISNAIFRQIDPRNGVRKALILSMLAAGFIALLGFTQNDQMMGIFFAFMAVSSYLTLQQMSGYGGRGF